MQERRYVNLFNQKTSIANEKSTHAVDIFAFVEAQEIPFDYFETPYILAPAPGGERIYAMLRETLRMTKKIGIAYVVIQARPQLAALLPQGEGLVLNTLRWACEENVPEAFDYSFDEDNLFHVGDNELLTAERMTDSMLGMWDGVAGGCFRAADMQAFADEDVEDDPGTGMILTNTMEDEENYEDGYLASLLSQARHHPPHAAASRHGGRRSPHAPQTPRLRSRARRY
jgi:DNA end-binding protein Ku